MNRAALLASVLGLTSLGLADGPAAMQVSLNGGPVGWVGLFNATLVNWLENENRLDQLCEEVDADPQKRDRCRSERMAPLVHAIPLRSAPARSAPLIGSILVMAVPGRGLRSFYVTRSGGVGVPFTPDLHDDDWGYGPYFHVTFLERRGNWFRLPPDPFPSAVWVDVTEWSTDLPVREIGDGDIVTSPFGDLYVLGLEADSLRARPEQEADLWCRSGDPPPLRPFKELRIPFKDLRDAHGHLLVHVKYTRGC
jgi:hypothetical protein